MGIWPPVNAVPMGRPLQDSRGDADAVEPFAIQCNQSIWRAAYRPHPQTRRPPRPPRPPVRHERRVIPMDESSIQITVGRSGSWRAIGLGDWSDRSLATKAALGGRASRRAVTRVNPEHASKVEWRMPTRAENGEGSTGGEATDASTHPVRRGSGDGTPGRHHGQRGRPAWGAALAATSPWVAALAGVGEGHSTVEAGQCRRREGPSLRVCLQRR